MGAVLLIITWSPGYSITLQTVNANNRKLGSTQRAQTAANANISRGTFFTRELTHGTPLLVTAAANEFRRGGGVVFHWGTYRLLLRP